MDEEKPVSSLANISVKKEQEEEEFSSIEGDSKLNLKPSSSTSGDYDEWLEIQKELGVFHSTGDSSKCKNISASGGVNAGVTGTTLKPSRTERTRNNGESLPPRASCVSFSSAAIPSTMLKNVIIESDMSMEPMLAAGEKRWCSSATDLERDLLEDTDSLDELAFHSQVHSLPGDVDTSNILEHDDITAQVQSAIDSILNLKKRPSSSTATTSAPGASQSSESKDPVLDQAVRSIMGS